MNMHTLCKHAMYIVYVCVYVCMCVCVMYVYNYYDIYIQSMHFIYEQLTVLLYIHIYVYACMSLLMLIQFDEALYAVNWICERMYTSIVQCKHATMTLTCNH